MAGSETPTHPDVDEEPFCVTAASQLSYKPHRRPCAAWRVTDCPSSGSTRYGRRCSVGERGRDAGSHFICRPKSKRR
eukprot:8037282-Prorocentrum_lima.AAC.1